MRILLDECVPWPMHKLLVGHECTTAQKRGWGGINEELGRLGWNPADLASRRKSDAFLEATAAARRDKSGGVG